MLALLLLGCSSRSATIAVPFVGWSVASPSTESGFAIRISTEGCRGRGPCAEVTPSAHARGWGVLQRGLDASPFRGRRVRVRAFVRADSLPSPVGGAIVGLRAVGADENLLLVERSPRATPSDWTEVATFLDVPAAANRLEVTVAGSAGVTRFMFDDVRLDDLGRAGAGDEPPRRLEGRGLANLVAFARLYGYVRYFHPSDQAEAADWDRIARAGVRACEPAASPAALAERLATTFEAVAPTLQVWTGSSAPAPIRAGVGDRVLFWRHRGVAGGSPFYRSRRIASGSRDAADIADPPDPTRPLEVDLGDGVHVRVPLAVPANGGGTLPHRAARPAEDETALPSAADRTTRLGDVIVAWNVFQQFSPSFPDERVDWGAALRGALVSAATDADGVAFLATLNRLVSRLHDSHARVSSQSGPAQGSLPFTWDWIDDRLVVTAVAAGQGGVQRGDAVERIGGRPVGELVAERETLISAATPGWLRLRALNDLRVGAPGQSIELAVEHIDGTHEIVRVGYGKAGERAFAEARPAPISMIESGIWYVDVTRLDDVELMTVLPLLAAAQAIVVDLRGYPSGQYGLVDHFLSAPVSSLPGWIPLTTRPDGAGRTFQQQTYRMFPNAPHLDARVAYLTNAHALSASENLLSVVEAAHLGAIVGAPTGGSTGDINWFQLPGGFEVYWSGMKVTNADGSAFRGIAPTLPVSPTRAGVAAGRDEVLEVALDWLRR